MNNLFLGFSETRGLSIFGTLIELRVLRPKGFFSKSLNDLVCFLQLLDLRPVRFSMLGEKNLSYAVLIFKPVNFLLNASYYF